MAIKRLDTGQLESSPASSFNASSKRMSVSLPTDISTLLEFLAKSQGITQNEVFRKAIATEAYFYEETRQGTKVLLQKPNGEIREVVFR
jgi:hypothetical protein